MVGVVGGEEWPGYTGTLQAGFFFDLADGTVFDGFAFVELAFGKIPFSAAMDEEQGMFFIPDGAAAGLDDGKLLPESLFQRLQVVVLQDPGMDPGGEMDPGGTGGEMPSPHHGGAQEAAGETPKQPSPSAAGTADGASTSAKAEMALQTSRLVVAYADPERPDRVTIAYLHMPAQPGQPDRERKLRDAIDRATEADTAAEAPTEERRG